MKNLENPIEVFEEWLEKMRQHFEIKEFKNFRDEMYVFISDIKNKKDINDIGLIVEKYRKK